MFRQRRRRDREGSVIAESAILLPLFVLITFGAIEASNYLYLRQSLTVAAFEAAMAASDSQGTEALAAARCDEILTARDVLSHTITVSPAVDEFTPSGTTITINVTAPASAYQISPPWFFSPRTVSANVTMVRT